MKPIFILLIASIFLFSCKALKPSSTAKQNNNNEQKKAPSTSTSFHYNIPALKNKKLEEICKQWLGTPYKYGGTTIQGTDCSGLVIAIYNYAYNIQLCRTSKQMYDTYKDVSFTDLKEGDLVFFSYTQKSISHVGVYLSNNIYIHASSKKGVMLSSLKDVWNKKYFVRGGRVL